MVKSVRTEPGFSSVEVKSKKYVSSKNLFQWIKLPFMSHRGVSVTIQAPIAPSLTDASVSPVIMMTAENLTNLFSSNEEILLCLITSIKNNQSEDALSLQEVIKKIDAVQNTEIQDAWRHFIKLLAEAAVDPKGIAFLLSEHGENDIYMQIIEKNPPDVAVKELTEVDYGIISDDHRCEKNGMVYFTSQVDKENAPQGNTYVRKD